MKTILLIEDDAVILKTNCKALELQGYNVLCASSLARGHALLERNSPDLIVLDILLPDGNGLDYCEKLRGSSKVPLLFLSALDTNKDIVAGLQAGGNCYLSKPYNMAVFLAQVQALLQLNHYEDATLSFGMLTLDRNSRRVCSEGKDLLVRPREFALLEILVKNEGFISSEKLYQSVWGMDTVEDTRTVKEHISRLRRKLNGHGVIIESKRGRGYRLKLVDN